MYVPCTNIEFVGCEEVIGQLALPFIAVLSPEHNVHRRSVYAGDCISVERILLIFFGRCLMGGLPLYCAKVLVRPRKESRTNQRNQPSD